ncbi:MAG: hypothetical protein FJ026_11205 [Chloroflexi bacterium]|nr:hypothetical protein [Chloroflexota bacterium]
MLTIELEGGENIAAIRNLLEQATSDQVVLVVPKGCEALEHNEVHLNLLRRWADSLALRLALVIEDRATQVLAREVGFVLLPSAKSALTADLEALDLKRRRQRGLPTRPSPSLLFAGRSQAKAEKQRRKGLAATRVGIVAAVLALLGIGLALLFVIPSATVTLELVSEPAQATMEMSGVAGLDDLNYGLAEVPAHVLQVESEITDTIATTGRRDVPDGHAQGTVVFANKTTIPVTITKGTVVRTSLGQNVRFYTVADALLPGELYGTVRVGILAAQPGPSGNVAPLTINVIEDELATQADVLNDARTSGGTVRRVAVVDSADKVSLRAKLIKQLQEESYKDLITALAPGDFVPPDSLAVSILEEEFDHNTGDMAELLGMRMKVKVTGLAVGGAGGEQLLLSLLEQRMQKGFRLIPGSAVFERGNVIEATPERARFIMSVRAAIAPAIDTQAISQAIAGKTVEAAKEHLMTQFILASPPEIQLRDSLTSRLPWWPQRIRTQIITR